MGRFSERQPVLYFLLCGVLVITLFFAGCSKTNKPEGEKGEAEPPGGPPPISKLYEQEPEITVYIHATGETKKMKMEDYIAGVVAAEMKTDWPVEALAAQAILARTFTLEELEAKGGTRKLHGTDACDKVEHFQAYDPLKINDNVRKAVQMTRGQVILYQDRYIHAWFSSSAGGKTALAKEALNFKEPEPPYLKVVDSPDQFAPPEDQAWVARFSKDEIKAAVAKVSGKTPPNVDTVYTTVTGPSGRSQTISIGGIEVPTPELRIALGSTRLRSTLFTKITVEPNSVVFEGKGFGHGVGMSQWGAYALAKDGKSPQDIINYYFKDVVIRNTWK